MATVTQEHRTTTADTPCSHTNLFGSATGTAECQDCGRPVDTTLAGLTGYLAGRTKLAAEPTAELVELRESILATGKQYVRIEILGSVYTLSIGDAVSLVDSVATALGAVEL